MLSKSSLALLSIALIAAASPLASAVDVIGAYDPLVISNWYNTSSSATGGDSGATNSTIDPITGNMVLGFSFAPNIIGVTNTTVSGNSISANTTVKRAGANNFEISGSSTSVTITAVTAFTYLATSTINFSGATTNLDNGFQSELYFGASGSNFPGGSMLYRNRDNSDTATSGSWTIDTYDSTVQSKGKVGAFDGNGQTYAPGTYTFRFTLVTQNAHSGGIDVAGPHSATGNFNVTLTPIVVPVAPVVQKKIIVSKYYDLNGNGTYEPGEPGLSDWDFHVTGPGGLNQNVTTGESGVTALEAPNGGATFPYSITETPKPGWVNTTPLTQNVTVLDQQTVIVEFGNQMPLTSNVSTVNFFKFLDTNSNNLFDLTDVALPNWTITLTDPNNNVITLKTDEDGIATANLIANGAYQVVQESDPGFLNVYATSFAFNAAGNVGNPTGDVQFFQLSSIIAPVPEPMSLTMLAPAAIALLIRRRRA